MTPKDNIAQLQGSIVELYWPDDGLWYRAEILALNTRGRSAKVRPRAAAMCACLPGTGRKAFAQKAPA